MAEKQEYAIITRSVAKAAQLKLSSDIPQIDPSTQLIFPGTISANQNNSSPGHISADLSKLNADDGSSDDLAGSTNSENISITSETSSLNHSISNDRLIHSAVGTSIDTAGASKLLKGDIEVNESSPEPIYSKQNNQLPSPTNADLSNQLPSPTCADQNNQLPRLSYADQKNNQLPRPSYANQKYYHVPRPSYAACYASETSSFNHGFNKGSIVNSVADASRLYAGYSPRWLSPPDQRGSKRKLSSAFATGSSSDSVYGSASSINVTTPVPKVLKPSPHPERLKKIKALADKYIQGCTYAMVREFYRNKEYAYFNDIRQKHGGIMKKYLKDKSGDQHCPINDKLKGLFFMCNQPDDNSPPKSPFGSKRLILPADRLLNAHTNLYFSDFFCLKRSKTHYISLVITAYGSLADSFCLQNLITLDKYNNPYLEMMAERKGVTDLVFVAKKSQLWVEVFYTEDVDIRGVPLMGGRNSGPRFVECESTRSNGTFAKISSTPKRKDCLQCNPMDMSGNKQRLSKIRALADKYIQGCSYTVVNEFCKTKNDSYFLKLIESSGTMRKYLKNNDGDPQCPINGKLKGILFMCCPDDDDQQYPGMLDSIRLILPANKLLNADTNLYFSDFFCRSNPKMHYISLVITTCGSEADLFCKRNLIELDKKDNLYVELAKEKKGALDLVYVVQKYHLEVEIFYTEDVYIGDVKFGGKSGPRLVTCDTFISRDFPTKVGIPKREDCTHCNPI